MASPAEVNRVSGTKPAERKSEGTRLGLVHSEMPATVVDRHPQQLAIRLLPIFVHVFAPEVSLPQNQAARINGSGRGDSCGERPLGGRLGECVDQVRTMIVARLEIGVGLDQYCDADRIE